MPRARFAAKLLLVAASLTGSLLLIEVMLRFAPVQPLRRHFAGEYDDRPSNNFVSDPVTGWTMRPYHQFAFVKREYRSTYRSNGQGFRSNADFEAPQRRKKIAVVGDSMAFGVGVEYEETYGALIESQLADALVYNLAMPGFGLDQMWLSVKYHALPLKPALVIVLFSDDNFSRSQSAYRAAEGFNKPTLRLLDETLVRKTAKDRPNVLARFLERHSSLWRFGRLTVPRALAHYIPFGEWWLLNEAILDAMRADCDKSRTALLFLYDHPRALRGFPVLRRYMNRVGAHFIDLTGEVSSARQDIYYPRDGHLNAKGHRFVADAVLKWIRNNLPDLSGAQGSMAPPR